MKFVKQGVQECVLATLAMLADVDIETARDAAADVAGVPRERFVWFPFFDNFPEDLPRRQYARDVAKKLQLLISPITYSGLTPSSGPPYDLSGRGQVNAEFKYGGGHSAAYEDGLVYDPNEDGQGESLEEYLKRLGDSAAGDVVRVIIARLEGRYEGDE